MSPAAYFGIAVIAFLAGSVPSGYLIALLFFRIDIRRRGSGNIGAMNALRTIGTGGALAVLVLDALKGLLPPLIVAAFIAIPPARALAALCAVLGHCFSPWLRGKGGKGVATSFGALFALSWPAALCAVGGWLIGAGATTFSSVGSLLGSLIAIPAIWYFTRDGWLVGYAACAAVLIFVTHRGNVARLLTGQESGISFLRRGA